MQLPVNIAATLSFPATAVSDSVVNAVIAHFRRKNPQYGKLKRMGYAGNREPREYFLADVERGIVHVWRGAAAELRQFLADDCGITVQWVDRRLTFKAAGLQLGTLETRDNQQPAVELLVKKHQGVLRGGTGTGKCLGRGTQVVLADGRRRAVEDLAVGDLLMGPDSKPRRVLSTRSGRGPLYRVIPLRGEAWVCNDAHVLSLVASGSKCSLKRGETYNVPIIEYLQLNKSQQHVLKLWRTGFELPESETKLPPYYLGLWLGDGRFDSPVICKDEPEVEREVEAVATKFGLRAVRYDYGGRIPTFAISGQAGKKNPVDEALEEARRDGEKRIPPSYACGSRAQRLELLAGLLDTDGYVTACGAEIITKYPGLADDMAFLARGLGFHVSVTTKLVKLEGWDEARPYLRLFISGDLSVVPMRIARKQGSERLQKKNVLRSGFVLEPLGEGAYFGFTLDGDHLFLLGDCTVTHNTETLLAAAIAVNQPTLVIVWNKDLLLQWKSRIAKYGILPANKIGEVHGGKKKFGAITVGMQQSLVKDPLTYAKHFGTLIFDECQRAPAETGMRVVNSFPAKYRWGASADERRTDRKEFLCYASIGEVVATIDRQESTLDPRFLLVPTDYEDIEYEEDRNYGALMNRLVWDEPRNKLIAEHLLRELRADAHVILFTERVEAALWWVDQVSSWGFKAGPLIGGSEFRDQVSATLAGLTTGKVRFAASTSYADVGLDVPILDTAFITCPTAGNVKRLEQQVGRVVRPHPEKGSARVFYFWDRNVDGLGVKKFKNITKRWDTVEVLER